MARIRLDRRGVLGKGVVKRTETSNERDGPPLDATGPATADNPFVRTDANPPPD